MPSEEHHPGGGQGSAHRLALPPGYVLDGYRIERVLGKGGFGMTYLARDLQLDMEVAIKEMLPDGIATRVAGSRVVAQTQTLEEGFDWARQRFVEEARMLARMQHKNIVRVQRLLEANGTAYMVMEYVEGQSLKEWLDRKKAQRAAPTEAELRGLLLPLLDGLEHVHGAGLLHRDIKPDNIFISVKGEPVLLDFGSARSDMGRTQTMTSVVSEGYSPYEQYQRRAKQGPPTDLYALAGVMVKAITGETPATAIDRAMDPDAQPPVSRTHAGRYSATFLQAVDAAFAVNAADRLPTVAVWRDMLHGSGSGAVPSSSGVRGGTGTSTTTRRDPVPPVVAPVRGGRALVHALLVFCMLGVSGAAVFFMTRGEKGTEPGRAGGGATGEGEREREPLIAQAAAPAVPDYAPAAAPAAPVRTPAPIPDAPAVPAPEPVPQPPVPPRYEPPAAPAPTTPAPVPVAEAPPPAPPMPAPPVFVPAPASAPAPAPVPAPSPLETATRTSPYVNTLGLEFIPLPGHPGVLMCRTETRVQDFRAYTRATGYTQRGGMHVMRIRPAGSGHEMVWQPDSSAGWERPGFEQSGTHPVVGVSWDEAVAFAEWLSRKEGHAYRLPTDNEWTAAAGSGKYPWGDSLPPPRGAGNYFGREIADLLPRSDWTVAYERSDGYPYTAPVGSFSRNVHGFHDLGGNVWEWTADRLATSGNSSGIVQKIPALRATGGGALPYRAWRGGSWNGGVASYLTVDRRLYAPPTVRIGFSGFRLVVEGK